MEEIRFEPKTGVHDGQMVRVDPTNNLLHFWWVEGVILREGELCNEHPIFKVGALVITFKHAKLLLKVVLLSVIQQLLKPGRLPSKSTVLNVKNVYFAS